MTQAFVLVNCDMHEQEMVLANLKEIKGVLCVYPTAGIYDLIVKVAADNEERLKEDVIRKIRATGGIRSTTTMIVV